MRAAADFESVQKKGFFWTDVGGQVLMGGLICREDGVDVALRTRCNDIRALVIG